MSSSNCQLQALQLHHAFCNRKSPFSDPFWQLHFCQESSFFYSFGCVRFLSQLVCQVLCLLVKGKCHTGTLGWKKFPSLHCKENTMPLSSRSWMAVCLALEGRWEASFSHSYPRACISSPQPHPRLRRASAPFIPELRAGSLLPHNSNVTSPIPGHFFHLRDDDKELCSFFLSKEGEITQM